MGLCQIYAIRAERFDSISASLKLVEVDVKPRYSPNLDSHKLLLYSDSYPTINVGRKNEGSLIH